MILILVLTGIFAILTVNLWRARQKNPKGPIPLPLIGNIHQLIYYSWKNGGIVSGFQELKKLYGRVFTVWFGPIPTIFIADFDVAHETHIKRANIFSTRYSTGGMEYIRGKRGIILSKGEFWQEHRRFALRTLRNFGLGRNIMEEKIMAEFKYRVEDFKKTNWKSGAIEVNALSFFDLLVGSIINQLLVSQRFEQDDEDFQNLKTNLAKSLESFSLIDAFSPLWLLQSPLLRWRSKTTFAPFDFVFSLVNKGIEQRISAIENGSHVISEEGDDFVDAFLIKMEKDKKDGIDSNFTLETLAIDLYDLWLAGQETTSTTLTWACVCLLNHPEVVEKVREELLRVTGGNGTVSLTDRSQTPFLNATINNRVVNNNIFRQLQEDTVIDGQPAAAGSVFVAQLSMIHTDEDIFRDASKFCPDRFLENNNLEKKLIQFGIGKRSCLGESLARAELYLILGNLILEYNLEPVGEVPEMKTRSPFGLMKRPPVYDIRFVPVSN